MNSETEIKQTSNDIWQRINAMSEQEYSEKIASEIKELHELTQQLNSSCDLKLSGSKMVLHSLLSQISNTRSRLSALVQINNNSAKSLSDLIQ